LSSGSCSRVPRLHYASPLGLRSGGMSGDLISIDPGDFGEPFRKQDWPLNRRWVKAYRNLAGGKWYCAYAGEKRT